MILDFATWDGSEALRCDLCIAGAGAAGITLALQFVERGLDVIVLESGGLDYEEPVQDLAMGENVGLPYFDLDSARLRFFGGTTNHWGGWCLPLDPEDFANAERLSLPGWPFPRSELDPYYRRATALVEIGGDDFDPSTIRPNGVAYPAFESLRTVLWRKSPPTRFGEAYRGRLERAGKLRVLLHANLVDIETTPSRRGVAGFAIQSLSGKRARVLAREYVLALGGLETPHIMLASGIGNDRDLVGRCFMEHTRTITGEVILERPDALDAYAIFERDGLTFAAGVTPSLEVETEFGGLSSLSTFEQVNPVTSASPGYAALRALRKDLIAGDLPDELGRRIWTILTDLDGVASGFWQRGEPVLGIVTRGEQAPDRESRVRLDPREVDALGLPRLQLDWRLAEIDRRTNRAAAVAIDRELRRLKLGRVEIAPWLEGEATGWPPNMIGEYHHLGTTRMADDPQFGIVDPNAQVFGQANLHVAGGSVFPSGGSANPTFTIVALSLRLADRLIEKLRG